LSVPGSHRVSQIVVLDAAKENVLDRWPAPYPPQRPKLVGDQSQLLLSYLSNWPVHLAPLPSRYTRTGTGPVFVKVTATTGKVFNGQLVMDAVHIKTDAGAHAVPLAKIQSLSFGAEKDTLVTEAETIVGKVEEAEFKLQLSVGVLEIPRDRIQKLEP